MTEFQDGGLLANARDDKGAMARAREGEFVTDAAEIGLAIRRAPRPVRHTGSVSPRTPTLHPVAHGLTGADPKRGRTMPDCIKA